MRLNNEDLILRGPPRIGPIIDKGFGEYFFEQADVYGDKIFQIDGETGKTESYSVVKQRTTSVAIYLQKINTVPKDTVMICCNNNTNNIIPALAAFYLGANVACIDPKQTTSDVRHSILLVEPKVIFVEENSLLLVEKSIEDCPLNPVIIVIGNSNKYVKMIDLEEDNKEEKNFKPIQQRGSDIATILFSSGTTSAPKGIYLTNSFLLNGSWRLIQHNTVKPGVILHHSSLYWVSAWVLTGITIITGTKKVVGSGITAEQFLQLIDKYKITYFFTSNTYTYEITKLSEEIFKNYNTSSLHCISIGGSTMDPQQILRLRNLLPHTNVALCYGSTEANYMVCHDLNNQKAYKEKVLSSGTALPETDFKFVDLETGKLVGPNKEGEIRCKSPYLMAGYYKYENPDCFDEDGFLKLGDVGYYDKDKYIYVTDRINDMFKYKTTQISPTILEHIILEYPDIAEAIVFGVSHPVDRNHAGACIILKDGKKVVIEELLDFVHSKVSDSYKLRAGIMIVDSFPKTPTGKYNRRSARDLFIRANKSE